ncbi:metallophosphoesterase [Acinetobacter nectaris]|uniref:metallophosphoesterase n=1 Tax=Acinetobacter nectaris TaxID=1219382 RepID=UPI001F2AC317|nr:metallophosphoesterase [Acinetobacter nectaris]MCF9046598.1 metallophosphoesterase [Acinetobacter nectaris]
MNKFIAKLFNGPLDIIGDVHGEIDALKNLIHVLGYDEKGNHPEQRKLIFVGDLCDRGIDSIAVIRFVKEMMDLGNAQCVLGNHELNILTSSKRDGNGWFFGSPHNDDHSIVSLNAKKATKEDRVFICDFLNQLPLALESNHLRIVHACWDTQAINEIRVQNDEPISKVYFDYQNKIQNELIHTGIDKLSNIEEKSYSLDNEHASIPLLKNLALKKMSEQMGNPIRVITSGVENITDYPFFAGGSWRMVDRISWWDSYDDHIPVIIGHYWRKFNHQTDGLFADIQPNHWFGKRKNVFCIDFSVGKRYVDRIEKKEFIDLLCAIRFPENILVFENSHTVMAK